MKITQGISEYGAVLVIDWDTGATKMIANQNR